jgi:hypothetical protein
MVDGKRILIRGHLKRKARGIRMTKKNKFVTCSKCGKRIKKEEAFPYKDGYIGFCCSE